MSNGFIYCARTGTSATHCKIGRSVNPQKRLWYLGNNNKVQFTLCWSFASNDMFLEEKRVHAALGRYRCYNPEW